MALITFEDRVSELEEDRDAIAETLRSIRTELTELRSRAEAGDLGERTETARLLGDVRYWLKAARETEGEIAAFRKEKAGIAYGYGLDLDAARNEVRCRIHRLRKCCASD
ncbi:hypothetical protein ROJ8625_02511 [Roseivivax jejudonensis]|uniref:Uncharacterized protein n=1 Tax=Roseivivax jejudonensis TaxID=1529041 RepID=A0A1X6ZGJ0_9RHOB|nr:hypothetical protein [Roseivivax jejudonensis]SLN50684.1 hypothetical protein ROJ8625_02511 [Roseivivax jejudonensis]